MQLITMPWLVKSHAYETDGLRGVEMWPGAACADAVLPPRDRLRCDMKGACLYLSAESPSCCALCSKLPVGELLSNTRYCPLYLGCSVCAAAPDCDPSLVGTSGTPLEGSIGVPPT